MLVIWRDSVASILTKFLYEALRKIVSLKFDFQHVIGINCKNTNGYLPITARCDQRSGVSCGRPVREARDAPRVELARARRTRRLNNWLLILIPDVVALKVLLLGLGHRARRRRDLAPSTVPAH